METKMETLETSTIEASFIEFNEKSKRNLRYDIYIFKPLLLRLAGFVCYIYYDDNSIVYRYLECGS